MSLGGNPSTITVPWDGNEDEDHVCSLPGCGAKAWDVDGCPLTYVTVVTQVGEEGYGEVTQVLCNYHLRMVLDGLMLLGFVSHNHHGTQMLDDYVVCGNCGNRCNHHTEYGPELVQPHG